MESAKKSCLAISLIFLLLLVSTVHGTRHVASVNGIGVDDDIVAAVRTTAGGHVHGSISQKSHNPSNPNDGGSGTPVVDPHNVATRGHHHRNTASRIAVSDPRMLINTLLGATFLLVLG